MEPIGGNPPDSGKAAAGRKPVLGIAGFYGHGNYGDELFLRVFEEHLGPHFELRILPDLLAKPYFSRPVEEMVADVDAILIGGGDLVRPWAIDERYFNKAYLEKPVFVVGVGVPIRTGAPDEAEKPHIARRYWRYFSHPNVKFVAARDPESAFWITRHINPSVPVGEAPDIVCSLGLPPVVRPAGNILGIVTRLRPNRDVPDDYGQLELLARHVLAQGWRVRHIILGTGIVGQRDLQNAADLRVPEKELVHSESLDDLSRAIGECSALASMKFHGTVVATMYGVPSIVLIQTSKNRNFMKRIGRRELLSRFHATDLPDHFRPAPEPIDPRQVTALRAAAIHHLEDLRDRILQVVAAG